jgi:hypothetical protein
MAVWKMAKYVCHFSFLYMVLIFHSVKSTYYENVSLLHSDLLTNYNKDIRPELDLSSRTKVKVGLYLVTLAKLDEIKGQISIVGFLNLEWTDNKLNWEPDKYNNVTHTYIPADKIWKPFLLAGNSVDLPTYVDIKDSPILVFSNGTVFWQPGVKWNLKCIIDTTHFPFDTQKCSITLIAWPYTSSDIYFISMFATAQTEFLMEDVTWELDYTAVTVEDDISYNPINFDIHFNRRHPYFTVTLLIPLCFIGVLNILVFKIPTDCGERIGYAITVLLSVSVFMTIASDLLPPSSVPHLSYLSILLIENLILSCLIMISTIYGLNCYHTSPEKPVHSFYHRLVCSNIKKQNDDHISKSNDVTKTMDTVTWNDVGEILDNVFFHFYLILLVTMYTAYIINVVK